MTMWVQLTATWCTTTTLMVVPGTTVSRVTVVMVLMSATADLANLVLEVQVLQLQFNCL